jgi:hypothetical protein
MTPVLDEKIIILRTQINHSVDALLKLTNNIKHEALASTIRDLKDRIEEPFMFVIVGEVKAGKSSFINALLEVDTDICKVAPSPMTDTIQQVIYGDPAHEEIINPFLKKLYQPVEILKEIAIVDTPGTNTIIKHHQEITERFIPGSDLIVFVFEAKNPYRQSAWDFFDFITVEWRKKIVFILQQKDLMEPDDLLINMEGVKKHAVEKGIESPRVFAVSAKDEQEGRKEKSGYIPLRAFISEHITGGRAPILKLESNVNTAKSIAGKIEDGLSIRQKQFDVDLAFREDITATLDKQANISQDQVQVLVENLLAHYDSTMREKSDELSGVLSFGSVFKRSISSIFSKKQSIKEWLNQFSKDLESDLNSGLKDRLNDRVMDLAESIQQMGQIIDLKIRGSQTVLKDDDEIFSDIAERRSKVLTDLREAFSNFLKTTDNFTDEKVFAHNENLSPTLATGSGIAVVGVILATVANGMVFDITGGVLTAVGIVFAGVSLGLQKRKIMRNFGEEIQKGRERLESEVTKRLQHYVGYIREKIDANFHRFDEMLSNEKDALVSLYQDHEEIVLQLNDAEKEIKTYLADSDDA